MSEESDIVKWVVILSPFWVTAIVVAWLRFADVILWKQKAKENGK